MAEIDFTNKDLFPYGRFGINNPVEELPGGTYKVPDYSTISSADLSSSGTDYSSSISTPNFPTPSPIKYEPTPQEEKISSNIDREMALTLGLAQDVSRYTQQQEQTEDITGKQKAVEDMQAQFRQIQAEQAALEAQRAKIIPQTELAARQGTSAYITSAGLSSKQAAANREIAIQQLDLSAKASVQAASLAAAQDNLSFAQSMVEKAVKVKFAFQYAELDALKENLTLLQNDPRTTRQDKERAANLLAEQNAKQDAIDENKSNYQSNLELANSLITEGVTDTVLIQKIQNAKDENGNYSVAEAQRLAAEAGVFLPGTDLTGTSSDLRTFATLRPDLKVGTPEFQSAFNQFVSIQAALKRAPEKETEIPDEVYDEKNLPGGVRSSIIEDLQGEEAKEYARNNGELTLVDLASIYPEVNLETLRGFMDEFYDFDSLVEDEEVIKTPWWKFWGAKTIEIKP